MSKQEVSPKALKPYQESKRTKLNAPVEPKIWHAVWIGCMLSGALCWVLYVQHKKAKIKELKVLQQQMIDEIYESRGLKQPKYYW